MNFSIAIMTFNKRFDTCFKPLIEKIRSLNKDIPIIVGVNGNYKESFDEQYRIDMLQLLSRYTNTYPIFFPEMRGWAKICNSMFIHSVHDHILYFSDDVVIQNDNILEMVDMYINAFGNTCTINHLFSHFICNRREVDRYGWFDERLLGFGEEDGDMIYRFLEDGKSIKNINISGLYNLNVDSSSSYERGVAKYSKFNREWIFTNKYIPDPNGITGTFDRPHKRICDNISLYPCETFYWENKNKL